MLSFASAEFWACFEKGDVIHYCNDYKPDKTYNSNYPLCMSVYRAADNCYIHGVWGQCMQLDPNKCSASGNTTFDLSPPIFKVLGPLNLTISSSKKIFLNFSLNEVATVYYRDLNKNTNTWIKVCDKCAVGNPSYAKVRSFAEGENNLMFKAVDVMNNPAYTNVKFFVDSTSPRIYTTLPKAKAFADGNFEVQFKEANPKKLTLNYGTDKIIVNLSKCYDGIGKRICDVNVNLSKYNGKTILYSFDLEDIAGSTYKSKPINVSVDTKAPIVNNPSSFFKVNGRYVDFNISITEDNFYRATFMKTNDPRAFQSTLCTRLVSGRCVKHQSFIKGNYSLSIQITDEAGHSIALPANFKID